MSVVMTFHSSFLFVHAHATPQMRTCKYSMFELLSSKVASFDWFVGLVFLLGWIEDDAPFSKFSTNSEPKPDKILCGQFGYYRMIE